MPIVGKDLLRAFCSLFYLQFCDLSDHWKNTGVAKISLAIWKIFLHENNCNYDSHRFSYEFVFILFLSFLTNQKQESCFQQIDGLVTRNISAFYLQRVVLYCKAIPNSINFYRGIFLNVIPVRIIVPWGELPFTTLYISIAKVSRFLV